jgi:hypothetical protein
LIYLCIPAHNEQQTVGVVLWKVRRVMADLRRDYQLLVADDASTDDTAAVLAPYARVLPLTVLRTKARRGHGASIEMLVREAVRRSEYPRRDVIIVLQSDFTEEPGHIDALLRRIESGADLVASSIAPADRASAGRRAVRWLARLMLRRFDWPAEVRDPLCGFHAYRVSTLRRAIEAAPAHRLVTHDGWAANAALLRAAIPHARRIDAVEMRAHPERAQRPSRFVARAALARVWSYVRSRAPAGLLPVDALAPDEVLTARSPEHAVTIESLHAAGVSRADNGPVRTGRGRQRNGAGRPGGASRSPGRRRTDGPADERKAERGRRPAAASEGETRKRTRTDRPRAGGEVRPERSQRGEPASGSRREARARGSDAPAAAVADATPAAAAGPEARVDAAHRPAIAGAITAPAPAAGLLPAPAPAADTPSGSEDGRAKRRRTRRRSRRGGGRPAPGGAAPGEPAPDHDMRRTAESRASEHDGDGTDLASAAGADTAAGERDAATNASRRRRRGRRGGRRRKGAGTLDRGDRERTPPVAASEDAATATGPAGSD